MPTTMADSNHPTLGHGKICYLEIPATDVNVSSSFYQAVFGWQIRKHGDGSVAFDDGVGQVSGTWVTKRKAATDPGLLVHIMVDSVSAAVDAVIAQGGEITRIKENEGVRKK